MCSTVIRALGSTQEVRHQLLRSSAVLSSARGAICIGGSRRAISHSNWRRTPRREIHPMTDEAEKRGELIRHLEEALTLADEIEDGNTGFLIERALDEARSRNLSLVR